MNLIFTHETGGDCIEELKPLVEAHLEEVRGHGHGSKVNLEWYVAQEKAMRLVFYSARDQESGEMVGYAAVFYTLDQFRGIRIAANVDAVFLQQKHRKGLTGARFLSYIERHAKELGAHCIYQSTTPGNDFGPVLNYLGYDLATITYAKSLGE